MFDKKTSRNLFTAFFAVLTVGSMALFFNLYEPWQPIGPELIPDGSFSSSAATNKWIGWDQKAKVTADGGFGGSPGVVLTTSSNEHGILRFTIHDLTDIPAFRVSLRATAQGVVKGKEAHSLPRAIFFYKDTKAKSLFGLHHGIMTIPEDRGWRNYKDFFPVPDDAASACLYIQNLGVAGTFQMDDISVTPVCARPHATWWKLFFGTLWTAAFVLCLLVLRPWARRYGFLIMVTLLLIMTGITLPKGVLNGTIEKTVHTAKNLIPKTAPLASQPPVQAIKETPAQPAEPNTTVIDQTHLVGHFTLFSLLAFLSALSWIQGQPSLRRITAVFAGLLLFAASTETLQFVTADRSAGLSDLRVDAAGMAGAVALVFFLRYSQHLLKKLRT